MNRETVTTTLRWVGDWPWYLGLTAATVLALAAWLLYRREAGSMASSSTTSWISLA